MYNHRRTSLKPRPGIRIKESIFSYLLTLCYHLSANIRKKLKNHQKKYSERGWKNYESRKLRGKIVRDEKEKLLHLGIKNERVHFVLHSIFRNFGRNLKLSVVIGSLRDKALLRVTNWKPTDFRILPQFA